MWQNENSEVCSRSRAVLDGHGWICVDEEVYTDHFNLTCL
jgi:hypothetical protein